MHFLVFSRFGTYCGFASQMSVLGFRARQQAYAKSGFVTVYKPSFLSQERRFFLLLFRCPREMGPVKKKGGNLDQEQVVLKRT